MHRERERLADGRGVFIRPIRAADAPLLVDAFGHLSPLSRYRRFFTPMNRLSPTSVRYLTHVDHHRHEAVVAIDDHGSLVGIARYICSADDPTAAELAVTVIDDWQSDGLGTRLVERLVRRAREEGVERFTGEVLWENRKMLSLLRNLGVDRIVPVGSGAEEFSLRLDDPPGVTERVGGEKHG